MFLSPRNTRWHFWLALYVSVGAHACTRAGLPSWNGAKKHFPKQASGAPLRGLSYGEMFSPTSFGTGQRWLCLGLGRELLAHRWSCSDVLLQAIGSPPNPLATHMILALIMLLAEMMIFFFTQKGNALVCSISVLEGELKGLVSKYISSE